MTVRDPAPPLDPGLLHIDIVVDNYNYAQYLEHALESALSQTHPHVNVVAVDDGSSDGSRAILERYSTSVDVVLKENGGQASALNAGLARCSGDIVIFLDADDTLDPNAARRVADVFARHPNVVHVPYRLAVVDAAGRRNGAVKPPPDMDLPQGDIAEAKLVFPFDIVSVGTSGNAFKIEALRRLGPIPEQAFADCADWYLVHLLPLLGRVHPVNDVLGCYRVHGANAYEPAAMELDLRHVRQSIRYAEVTTQALERLARQLGRPLPYDRILSVSDLANRLISLRLDPARHPRLGDTVTALVRDGVRAARRRWDSPASMKALFVVWFLLTATAPRPILRQLALVFLFRERRTRLNRLFGRVRRRRRLSLAVKLQNSNANA